MRLAANAEARGALAEDTGAARGRTEDPDAEELARGFDNAAATFSQGSTWRRSTTQTTRRTIDPGLSRGRRLRADLQAATGGRCLTLAGHEPGSGEAVAAYAALASWCSSSPG